AATSAHNMAFAIDQIARFETKYICANLGDLPDEFVPDDHGRFDRLLSPVVPIVDVDIRAADRSAFNPDQHIVDPGFGDGNVDQRKADTGLEFGEGAHCFFSHGR